MFCQSKITILDHACTSFAVVVTDPVGVSNQWCDKTRTTRRPGRNL